MSYALLKGSLNGDLFRLAVDYTDVDAFSRVGHLAALEVEVASFSIGYLCASYALCHIAKEHE